MSEHTPGPWTGNIEDVGGSFQIYPKGSFLDPWIADVKCEHVGPNTRAEIIANAHLIIASPDLLAACKAMLSWKTGGPDFHPHTAWEMVRLAVAKAEGKSND